jgi:hypothetical protein
MFGQAETIPGLENVFKSCRMLDKAASAGLASPVSNGLSITVVAPLARASTERPSGDGSYGEARHFFIARPLAATSDAIPDFQSTVEVGLRRREVLAADCQRELRFGVRSAAWRTRRPDAVVAIQSVAFDHSMSAFDRL